MSAESRRYGTDSPFPAFTAVHSGQNEPITIMYEDSQDGRWKALGFVIDRVTRRYERIEDFATLTDTETLDFGFFGENGHEGVVTEPGDDRLRVGTEHERRLHELAIGIEPTDDEVLVGVENPSDADIVGIEDDRTRGFGADKLTDFGSVSSDDTFSVEGVPTTALAPTTDQGLVRFDTENNGSNPTRVGVVNNSGGQVTLSAEVFGMAYEVTPITDSELVRTLLYEDTTRTLTYGGQGNTSPNLPDEWDTAVTRVGESTALQWATDTYR